MVKLLIKGVSEEKTFGIRNILKTDLFFRERRILGKLVKIKIWKRSFRYSVLKLGVSRGMVASVCLGRLLLWARLFSAL